ncbi:hypothetical protein BD410DRAFT_352772 [Rickenella mellea]|uniref:Uncharacterized protein n=1 Tax=Rickenella mellea TaxID=50990 RepID=A0A4Y7QKQ9_9AGAM|nr:hypothetical protein BD410DRAFT_352772 [Rickenella mellea]
MPSPTPAYPSFTLVVTEKLWGSRLVCYSRATYGRRSAFDVDSSVDALMVRLFFHHPKHVFPTGSFLLMTMDHRWQTQRPRPPLPMTVRHHPTRIYLLNSRKHPLQLTAPEYDEVWQTQSTVTMEDDEVSEISELTLGEPTGTWRTMNARWLRVLHGRVIRLVSLFRRNAKKNSPQL